MSKVKLLAVAGVLFILCGFALAFVSAQAESSPLTLSGTIMGADGPLADAVVQIRGTANKTQTSDDGAFTLSGVEGVTPITIAAWSAGYYIGWTSIDADKLKDAINITLNPLPQGDHSEYDWYSFEGVDGSAACGLCHRENQEWQIDQHAQAAVNPHFITMYTGTDINGQVGQDVRWGSEGAALPPDPSQPYYGPGFRLDNPGRAGNCATCHTPMASKSPNTQNCSWSGCHTSLTIERSNGVIAPPPASPQFLHGDAAEGISCEFCHKIGEVYLNPETHMPYSDMPGILSYRLYRPADDSQQVFFGTLVDVARQDSYLPLLSQSEFCAGCHFGEFGGVVGMGEVKDGTIIYNSYGEWLNSPYSDPETGKTCQDCHMPISSANWFVRPERGGLIRDHTELHDHTMLGAANEEFLQNAVTMVSDAQRSGDQIQVEVNITNDKTGHDIPTDAPIRSMILVVEALDADGNPLALAEGPVNPDYSGDYGGTPGKTFAKVLRDNWTGETPTAAFWRPVTIVEDSRLPALATDTTNYIFDAPAGSEVTVNVRLIFRRSFYELMKQKGWTDPDILMEHETLNIPAN
jgi:hypothetical protein